MRSPLESDQTDGRHAPAPIRCSPRGPNVACTGSPSGVASVQRSTAALVAKSPHVSSMVGTSSTAHSAPRSTSCGYGSRARSTGTSSPVNSSIAAGPSSNGTTTSTTPSTTVCGSGRGVPPNGLASSGVPVTSLTLTRMCLR
ncbi:hypothetical protein [Nonomuraea recticatena]|uniref:hypothetical protein n=1 Tax=Nonomuraea recticatena TaxID=46178 RepID=UPI0036092225